MTSTIWPFAFAVARRRSPRVWPTADLPPRFDEYGYALLLADGLGGSGSGAVASRVAVSALAHLALHYGHWNVRIDDRTAVDVFERAEWFYRQVDDAVVRRQPDR